MKLKFLIVLGALIGVSLSSFAQKIKVDGSLKPLKDVKTYDLEFIYDGMSVGKFDKEEDYVNEQVAKKEEKEPGTGATWKENWVSNRTKRFEPKYIELFNDVMKDKAKTGIGMEGEVKMVVKTTFTEPGFNIGVMRKPAAINAEITFINVGSGEKIATMTLEKVPGADAMGYDFDAGARLSEAYAKMGKSVAKYLLKNIK